MIEDLSSLHSRMRLALPLTLVVRGMLLLWGAWLLLALRPTLPPAFVAQFYYGSVPSDNPLIAQFQRWDVLRITAVAVSGYAPDNGSATNFPLLPLAIHWLSFITGDTLVAGLILSNVAAMAALALLYRLTRSLRDDATARRAAILLAFFPTAFFLFMPYTESLFLTLAVGAIFAARQRRWGWAGLLAGAAALTRILGVLLVLPLAVEAWEQRKAPTPSPSPVRGSLAPLGAFHGSNEPVRKSPFGGYIPSSCATARRAVAQDMGRRERGSILPFSRRRFREVLRAKGANSGQGTAIVAVLAAPLGLLTYMAYLYLTFGNPVLFLTSQSLTQFSRRFAWPGETITAGVAVLFSSDTSRWANNLLDLIATLAFLLLLIPSWRRLPRSLGVYAASQLLLPLFTLTTVSPLYSMPRFVLPIFPAFIILAGWTGRQYLFLALWTFFALGLFFLFALFTLWYWVA